MPAKHNGKSYATLGVVLGVAGPGAKRPVTDAGWSRRERPRHVIWVAWPVVAYHTSQESDVVSAPQAMCRPRCWRPCKASSCSSGRRIGSEAQAVRQSVSDCGPLRSME